MTWSATPLTGCRRVQNPDGGWGETCHSYVDESFAGVGTSTPSQTAWAMLTLQLAGLGDDPACARGRAFLVDRQRDGTWDEPEHTGTGFPGDFYINYHLYRHVFPTLALAGGESIRERQRRHRARARRPQISHENKETAMAVPLRQAMRVGSYVAKQRLRRNEKFALVLQLEPLYQCNLACAGCGKIQHEDPILQRRLTVQQCIDAVEECEAPMVSIAGGEPLVHKEIDQIVAALVARKRYVYLCTNALLLEKKLHLFTPSPYFSFSIHIDGLRERHDESVCRTGVFDKAIAAIASRQSGGFPRDHQHDVLRPGRRRLDPRRARLPQRRGPRRQHADLAGLRL